MSKHASPSDSTRHRRTRATEPSANAIVKQAPPGLFALTALTANGATHGKRGSALPPPSKASDSPWASRSLVADAGLQARLRDLLFWRRPAPPVMRPVVLLSCCGPRIVNGLHVSRHGNRGTGWTQLGMAVCSAASHSISRACWIAAWSSPTATYCASAPKILSTASTLSLNPCFLSVRVPIRMSL